MRHSWKSKKIHVCLPSVYSRNKVVFQNLIMHFVNKHIAFNSLFNRHYSGLCVYCESFVGEKQVAEDLVQDVFVNIWVKHSELNYDDTLRSYLYKAVHNASIHFLRQQKVKDRYTVQIKTKLIESECIPYEWVIMDTDHVELNEIQNLYRQALQQMPAQTREIFLCSREKEMKYSEIADLTGLSVKSIEYHISKALEVLRIVLKDYLK